MIQTLTILYLLGVTCFSSASQIGGQSVTGHLPLAEMPNKNHQPPTMSWQSTPTQSGNRQENVQQSRSPESENEINDGDNTGVGGDENMAPTEDKQVQAQPAHQQQTQPGPNPASQANLNKKPAVSQQQINPNPYEALYTNGNHPPGMPVTQYSGMQVIGYQKEQSGQAPISQQHQMFYSGGSNAIPMIIYSDSERPPITMFYLGQGDKQFQGALKTGDFIPNLQPMGTQQMIYSQSPSPLMPMPFFDPAPSVQMSSWDRHFPMFETFSSPQYYPSSNVIMKTKESQKVDRLTPQKSLKPKSAEFNGMSYENDLSEPMGRAASMIPLPQKIYNPNLNPFNSRDMDNQIVEPWMIPQRQKSVQMSNMRSVMNPFWGGEPKQSKSFDMREPMERSSSYNMETSILGSRYTSLPISPYTSPSSSSYLNHGGQQSSLNQGDHSQSHSNSGAQNQYNHDKQNTAFVQRLPNGGQISTFSQSQKGYNAASQGHSNVNNANRKYQTQHGEGQGSSNYHLPGSSYSQTGPGGFPQTGYTNSVSRTGGLLASANPQHQYSVSQGSPQNEASRQEQDTPIIAIVPVGGMLPSHQDQYGPTGLNKNLPQSRSFASSIPRNALLGSQYSPMGLVGGYSTTGLNNQYSNLHNGQYANQNSGASNNQQYGHENVNTGFVQPLPSGGQIYTQVNSDKGYSGGNYGQGSSSLGVNDQNFNAGGFNSNQGYNTGLGGGVISGTGLGGGVISGLTGVTGVPNVAGLNNVMGLGGGLYG